MARACAAKIVRLGVALLASAAWIRPLAAQTLRGSAAAGSDRAQGAPPSSATPPSDGNPPLHSPQPLPIAPISTSAVPLHASDGTHHVYVYVGSPPQRRTLIVDTGSRLMAFPCKPCPSCGKHTSGSHYDPRISTTDVPIPCGACKFQGLSKCSWQEVGVAADDDGGRCVFDQHYTEGSSLTAYEVEDLIWLGTASESDSVDLHMGSAVPFTFGCQMSETGLFRTQYADGIIGMNMHPTSLMAALIEAGAVPRDAFGLCLDREGGMLAFGGTSLTYSYDHGDRIGDENESERRTRKQTGQDTRRGPRHLEPMQFTPLVNHQGWYTIQVISVHVGDVLITSDPKILFGFNSGKGTIIDSGTTDTYLPRSASGAVMGVWKVAAGRELSHMKQRYSFEEFGRLPEVTLGLEGGVVWSIPPVSDMEPLKPMAGTKEAVARDNEDLRGGPWEGTRIFTNRIYVDEASGCVLGGNAMLNHDILFDVTGGRIGVAQADCAYSGSGRARA